jgi:hypothetical protein
MALFSNVVAFGGKKIIDLVFTLRKADFSRKELAN